MRISSMFFALLLASASLAAQTSTGNSPTVLVKPPAANACPVLFSVERVPGAAVVEVNRATTPQTQGLNLTFARPAARIVAADITVHFYAPTRHAIPAAPSTRAAAAPTETFHLTAGAGEPLVHSSISTSHSSVVNWVELTHVDFADGNSWQATTPRQCGAAPSLYVLVDSTR